MSGAGIISRLRAYTFGLEDWTTGGTRREVSLRVHYNDMRGAWAVTHAVKLARMQPQLTIAAIAVGRILVCTMHGQ